MSQTGTEIDGRRRRADESRRRIALAMIELLRDGELNPSADLVAERAGVGRRTVFRLFNDMEGVYREIHAVMVARLTPIFAAPFASKTWRARIDEMIARRARMFEEMLPIKTAADAHRQLHGSKFLEAEHKRLTRLQREALRSALPPSVAERRETIEALDLALSFEAWRRLRYEQGLSARAAAGVLTSMAAAILG